MSTLTTKLGMSKPADDDTSWGDEIRGALDILDKALVSHYFGEDADNHAGLDFAYLGGVYRKGEVVSTIAGGTITLSDDTTNYVFVDVSADGIAKNTTGFISGDIPLFTVVTASGAIDTVTDNRTLLTVDAIAVDHDHDSDYFTETEMGAVTDGSAGADLVGMTAIAETGEAATVQAVIEALVTRLKAVADGSSGADLIGATEIAGLTGLVTVQSILEAIAGALTPAFTDLSDVPAAYTDQAGKILAVNSGADALEFIAYSKDRGVCLTVWDDLEASTSVAVNAVKIPYAMTVTNVLAEVKTAPVGADLILDIHKNGTTIFTTQANRPTIAAGNTTVSSAAPDVTSFAAGDLVELFVDQVGSTTAGSKLAVGLPCEVS